MPTTPRELARALAPWRRRRTGFVGQRERLSGAPSAATLIVISAFAFALAAITAWLALPGAPDDAGHAVMPALQDVRVLVPVGVAVAVTLAGCVRGWTYRRLLHLPGPIQILPLEFPASDDAHGATDPDRVRLDMHFRERLSEANLSAFTAGPGTKVTTDFVELLEASTIDANQPFAMAGRIMRIVRPAHAYEVKATIIARPQAPCCGVVTEVVVLPRRRTTLRTYWAETWDEALDSAATGVTVQVVPRSRHSNRGVWSSWKGYALNEDLVDAYNRARRLQRGRHYEEALEELFKTVRRDPGNGYLRFAVGAVQEQLALYVDALLTYRAIWQMEEQRPRAGRRGRASRRIGLFARYKYTSLLGIGEALAEQWLSPPPGASPSRRSSELRALRKRLRPILLELFSTIEVDAADRARLGLGHDDASGAEVLLDERPHVDHHRDQGSHVSERERARVRQKNRRLRERRLHLFFQLLAEGSVEDLHRRYSGRSIARLDVQLTHLSHELLASWARLRTQRARHLLDTELRRQRVAHEIRGLPSGTARKRQTQVLAEGWPPTSDDVEALWRSSSRLGRNLVRRLDASHEFLDHYMAACILSIGLLPGHDGRSDGAAGVSTRERMDQLTVAAVGRLRRAAEVGGSSAVAARWNHIITSDPDLAGLRGTEGFRRFTSDWLPSHRPEPVRPTSIVRLLASRNSVRLCRLCAGQVAEVWHARGERAQAQRAATVLRWIRDEEAAWQRAAELAQHHRHWQTRLEVIRQMQAFCRRHGVTSFRPAHPGYLEAPITGNASAVDKSARHETHLGDLRLAALADVLTGHAELPGSSAWVEALEKADASGVLIDEEACRRLAEERARTWRGLEQLFRVRATNDDNPRETFERQFEALVTGLADVPPPEVSSIAVL